MELQGFANVLSPEATTTIRKGLDAGCRAGWGLSGLAGIVCIEHVYYQSWEIAVGALLCSLWGVGWTKSTTLAIERLGPAASASPPDALQDKPESAMVDFSNHSQS
jgi:hypothetical protein